MDRLQDVPVSSAGRYGAPWVHALDDGYAAFAGGTRLLAAQRAGLTEIPVVLHDGLTDDDFVRLAYIDNEQTGKHASVSSVDVRDDYIERMRVEG